MRTRCPNCRSEFNVAEAMDGRSTSCPKCGSSFTVHPDPNQSADPSALVPRTPGRLSADVDAVEQAGGVRNAMPGATASNGFGGVLGGPPGPGKPEYDFSSSDNGPGYNGGSGWVGFGGGSPGAGGDNDPIKLLRDIRDGIRALSGGYNPATGQAAPPKVGEELGDEETKKFYSRAGSLDDWSNLLAGQSAGQSQSASNLFGAIRTIGGNVIKRLRGWGGQKILSTHGAHIPPPSNEEKRRRGEKEGVSGKPVRDAVTGRTAASLAKAAKTEASGIGTVAKGAALRISGLAAAALEAGKQVYAFARAQEKEIRRLAEVGGEQAAAVAILDVNRIKRDINTARETGETSTGLTESINRFEEALRPVEVLMTNLANTVGAGLLDLLTGVVDVLGGIAEGVSGILSDLGLWSKEESKRKLKELPAQQIERIVKDQEKIERPQWPGAGIGGPGSVSAPVHGGPSGWQ